MSSLSKTERWTRRADSEGVFLIVIDFSDNATLFVYFIVVYIAVESYGYQNGQFSVIYVHRRCFFGPVCNEIVIDNGYVHATFRRYMHVSFVFLRPECNLSSGFREGISLYFLNNGWHKHMTIFGRFLTK